LLWVSDSTVRIGVARGGMGSGLEGLAASMWAADARVRVRVRVRVRAADALFLCGS